jgi:hyperosmotically inducible protein
MKLRSFLVLLLVAGLTPAAFADASRDSDLQSSVADRLVDVTKDNGPWVDVNDGVATLSGKVPSVWAKNEAISRALEVEGVTAVEDTLEIANAESDKKLAEAVANTVRRYPFFTIFDDVNLSVDEGHVGLSGRVTMPFKADEIERRVSKVMGVQSVKSEIATLPVNIGDQKLRSALAYRIYNDSLFQPFAFRAHPPIHIVVERGRVALTGAVRTQVEKRKAELIARSTFGVFSVDNRLSVGD